MCGIIGTSASTPVNKEDIKLLYLLADERGGDACGFTNNRVTKKSLGKAPDFLSKLEFPEKILDWIGHTRSKTYGINTLENAHPFEFENVTGVHNGTIENFHALKNSYQQKFDVDSELIYWMISTYGLKWTLPKLSGALALAYWDKRDGDNGINLYRFDRPLFLGYKTIYNSETNMFNINAYFGSTKEYLEAIDCIDIKELEEHTHYRLLSGVLIKEEKLDKELSPSKKPAYVAPPKQIPAPPEKAKPNLLSQKGLPWYKKMGVESVTGEVLYWWFDEEMPDTVIVKTEYSDTLIVFDLSNKQDETRLSKMYRDIYEDIVSDYLRILCDHQIVEILAGKSN